MLHRAIDGLNAGRGLEQQVALPRDSYLQPYYADVFELLRVGPPLLLVVRGLNVSRAAPDVNAVCSTAGCRDDSLLNRVGTTLSSVPSCLCKMSGSSQTWLSLHGCQQ